MFAHSYTPKKKSIQNLINTGEILDSGNKNLKNPENSGKLRRSATCEGGIKS